MSVPCAPTTPAPTFAPELFTSETVFVSPLASTSVSFASTSPVALLPAVPFSVPPASFALPVSSTATGASLLPWIVTVSVAVSLPLWPFLFLICAQVTVRVSRALNTASAASAARWLANN